MIKSVSETIKIEQKGRFRGILLCTLGASLLGYMLTGKWVIRGGDGVIRTGERVISGGDRVIQAGEGVIRGGDGVIRASEGVITAGQDF